MTGRPTFTLEPYSPVRLSCADSVPANVGYVMYLDRTRDDGMRFWLVDFTPDREGGLAVISEAELVPVCEFSESYPDEWGLACSEPGVPTSMEISCHFDATDNVLIPADEHGPEAPMALCSEHAERVRREISAEATTTTA